MAPEVGLGLPYNLKADVYSWSMLMWYILALEPPVSLVFARQFAFPFERSLLSHNRFSACLLLRLSTH